MNAELNIKITPTILVQRRLPFESDIGKCFPTIWLLLKLIKKIGLIIITIPIMLKTINNK